MAWLEREPSGVYHVAFRFGDQKFKKSLKTDKEDDAEARRYRLEENIRLVESGRLALPEHGDVAAFLLSDGKLDGKPKVAKRIDVGDLFEAYKNSLPKDALEPGSLRVAAIHMRHFVRILGSRRLLRTISGEQLQEYVTTRSHQPGRRGKYVSAGTIKKELSTFSSLWTWAASNGFVDGPFPKAGIKYPKIDEKPPFQTCEQIERQIESGGLTEHEQQELWDCLYLSSTQVAELLDFIGQAGAYPFLYPMCVMAAHTGARRSELCRSQTADFDLVEGIVRIRERKRAKGKRTTRTIPLTSKLRQVMREWFVAKPPSKFTFPEDHRVARIRKERPDEGCVAPDEASHHLALVLSGSKWEKLRGWHVLRHSFISNCACKGVHQRMIDAWVGHQTEEMRQRYTHLFPDVQERAIQKVFA